ncbi:MAG: GNAT family N-acetyltransferase [Erysipelotrichaceae bacterium]|nr:GNAT family N-acetyltransferase [Erysipelotrichaceae bacterium]
MNVPIDLSNVVLHTERLTIRPWNDADLHDLYEYARVDGVGQMAGWKPHESIEESARILKMFIDEKKTFALEYEGKVIGSLGIEQYSEEHFPEFEDQKAREIGYVLSKDYWGQGLMPEAVREVIRYLFEEAGLDVIFCGHFLRNIQSQRVQEKCGFHHYAYDTFQTETGLIEDNEVNILTKEEYDAKERNDTEIIAS